MIDELWIVQNNHGPFNPDHAPEGTAWPEGDDTPSRTHDHWAPLLGFPTDENEVDGKTTLQHITEFKNKNGERAYGKKLDTLLRYVNVFMHSQNGTQWEDVRGDGSDTGAWFRWKDQADSEIRDIMR